MTILAARDISISFGGIKAIDGVSFAVSPGKILSIIGPNGAGKTTIFNLISLIYPPTSGRIHFEGREITYRELNARANRIAQALRARSIRILQQMSWSMKARSYLRKTVRPVTATQPKAGVRPI